MQNKNIYKDLGLTDKQALIYDHLLSHGPHSVAKLAEETKIHRGIVFFIIKELMSKALVEKNQENKAVYSSTHPDRLMKMIDSRQADIEKTKKQLEAELPALITNFSLTSAKPGVVYFEGPYEFQKVYDDILRVGQNYKNIFSSFNYNEKYLKNANTALFRERRFNEKVKAKIIYKPTPEHLKEYFDDQSLNEMNQVRFIPENKLVIPSEIIIYGPKVALISFNPTLLATVIDNPDISQTFSQLFDYIWESTEPFHKKVIEEYTLKQKAKLA